ncbi:MAG: hypothetical protein LBG66_05845, partial [Gallionellaceae bacterium]|jgi:ABC-2 type transport system ATP-binding protein|nr:hypothetical protein [Gallionellaceae bacterium]
VLRDGTLEMLLSEGETTLSLRADNLDAERLAQYGSVTRDGAFWQVRLADGVHPVTALAALEAAGTRVRQASFGRQNLEQLFMSLTQRSLRDT